MAKTVRYFHKEDENEDEKAQKGRKRFKNKYVKKKEEVVDGVITYKASLKPKRKWNGPVNPKQSKKPVKRLPNPKPKYPGRAPVDGKVLKKYSRGEGVNEDGVQVKINQIRLKQKEKKIEFSAEQAARAEILRTEQAGVLTADPGETTTQFRQSDLVENLDITTACKHFDLHLPQWGPYRIRYTPNGRHLLLGGRRGHVATFDWLTKKLHCELNVMEEVMDVCWLHQETLWAAAQKKWVYIYDNQGTEIHCLKRLNRVERMEFLKYHFLLATTSDEGFLSWLDVSIGKMVSQFNTKQGSLRLMCQNPWNAVLCVGHSTGTVSMWSPNQREPQAKILCHPSALTALHVDPRGLYLATAGTDRGIKIWDVRKMEGPLQSYRPRAPASDLAFSEKSLLAVAMGNVVEVYKDCCNSAVTRPYLRHCTNTPITQLRFCPYEDVLGLGTTRGFTSLIAPGSGEPNFDAFEVNPYQSKKQRREAEVKALLEKIPAEFIHLDPSAIADLDIDMLKHKLDAKKKLLYVKPSKINFETRKAKKRTTVQVLKAKKILQEQTKREFLRKVREVKEAEEKQDEETAEEKPSSVLDRFLPKPKRKKASVKK